MTNLSVTDVLAAVAGVSIVVVASVPTVVGIHYVLGFVSGVPDICQRLLAIAG